IMPVPWKAVYEEWRKEFEKNEVNENTVLIGHSCGCAFLVRWLGETNKKISKLVLVAPWKIPDGEDNLELKKAFYNYDINPSVKNNVNEIIIFTADDEEEDGKKSAKIFNKVLGGQIIELKGKGHYCLSNIGIQEFPELLKVVLGEDKVFTKIDNGEMVNSGEFNGMRPDECIKKISKWLEEKRLGKATVNYKLRDWIFSRQRYWGEPIPMVQCKKCGWVPVNEKDLPIILPDIEDFMPTDEGDSPLAKVEDWVKTKCSKCGGEARRETDVMPNWAGSNWYFIRYCDPKNKKMMIDPEKAKYWLPVDWYNGGMEHTTLHLLYSRFVFKFLYDIKAVPQEVGSEPYAKRTAHGMILGEGGIKMSKSKGNVINPDEYISKYGADTVRLYEMFMGPFDQSIAWDIKGVVGVHRFLEKVWKQYSMGKESIISLSAEKNKEVAINKLIKKISNDIENMKFNTAISSMMEFVGQGGLEREKDEDRKNVRENFVKLLSPFAPHLTEELWEKLGHKDSIMKENWPEYDEKYLVEDEITLAVQVNGKVRCEIVVPADISEKDAQAKAVESENIQKWLDGKEPKKVIYIKNKLVSIVV
ncbi:class I tRNA ligase family protein, partial [Patescibacteria group bacterium]